MDITNAVFLIGLPSSVTAFCFWLLQRNINKREKQREEREKIREENDFLLSKEVGAAIALGEATARAIRDGKHNGEMSAALEYAKKVKHERKDFMERQSIRSLN
ncbi:MAG: serine/threonine protein kinase [Monoglobales bacterium]